MPSWQPSILMVSSPRVWISSIQRLSRFRVSVLDGVEHQPGEEEVVDREALGRHLVVQALAVLGVDLREDGQVVLPGDGPQPIQILPGAGLVEEVRLSRLLVQVGEGVQPNDLGAIARELPRVSS
jgi:hypothetical protein